MTLVQIIKSWAGMDLLRQTPGGQENWEDIRFTEEPVSQSDYVVVLNRASEDTTVYCPPHHVWALIQEPPSEKLADCFLAWTMPIYYGCRNITEYFPEESLVQIDITKPDSLEKVEEAICSDAWKRNRDAVTYARDLILNHYQLFPFLTGEIKRHQELDNEIDHNWQSIFIPSQPRGPLNSREKARKFWRRIAPRKLRKYLFNHLPSLERFR